MTEHEEKVLEEGREIVKLLEDLEKVLRDPSNTQAERREAEQLTEQVLQMAKEHLARYSEIYGTDPADKAKAQRAAAQLMRNATAKIARKRTRARSSKARNAATEARVAQIRRTYEGPGERIWGYSDIAGNEWTDPAYYLLKQAGLPMKRAAITPGLLRSAGR